MPFIGKMIDRSGSYGVGAPCPYCKRNVFISVKLEEGEIVLEQAADGTILKRTFESIESKNDDRT